MGTPGSRGAAQRGWLMSAVLALRHDQGITWDVRLRLYALAFMTLLFTAFTPALGSGSSSVGGATATVIVELVPGSAASVSAQITSLGGHVIRNLESIDALVAEMPVAAARTLASNRRVLSITPDSPVQLLSSMSGHSAASSPSSSSPSSSTTYDPTTDVGSAYNTTALSGAQSMWSAGYTGKGVTVALIDSGVSPVQGLAGSGKLMNGPDLSFDSQASNL